MAQIVASLFAAFWLLRLDVTLWFIVSLILKYMVRFFLFIPNGKLAPLSNSRTRESEMLPTSWNPSDIATGFKKTIKIILLVSVMEAKPPRTVGRHSPAPY